MAMEGSGKLHCCSIVLLFLCGLVNKLQSVTSEIKISTICNTTNSTWAMLSCSSDSWYHVIQELYSPANNNCSFDNSNNSLQENSDRSLSVSCAGPASPPNTSVCSESVRSGTKDYNEALVEVTYECIPESKMYNLCLKQEVNLEGQVYLASPLMFASSETSLFNSCVCEITGVLRAEVLYGDVDNSDVNITCGNWSRHESLFIGTVVNTDLGFPNKACTMRIIYRDDNRSVSTMTGQVWMKVSGVNMTLKCSEQPPDSAFTLSSTTTGTMSTTTSSSTKTSLTTSFTSQESFPDSTVISSRCSPSSMSSPSSCISLLMSNDSRTFQAVPSTLQPTLSTSQFLPTTSQPVSIMLTNICSNMKLNCDGKSSDAVVGSTVSTTLSTEDTSTMSTAASSNDRPPSTTSSSRVSSPDAATISTGTETMTSTPSSFSTPVSKLLVTSIHLITDIIATVLSVVGLWHLVDDKIAKVKLATRYILLYFWYGLQHYLANIEDSTSESLRTNDESYLQFHG